MPAPILPLLLGIAALGGIALASKDDKKPETPPTPPPFFGGKQEVAQAVANALGLETDPAKLRAFAASLRQMGFPTEAGLLEQKALALEIQAAQRGALPGVFPPGSGPASVPFPLPQQPSPLPPIPIPLPFPVPGPQASAPIPFPFPPPIPFPFPSPAAVPLPPIPLGLPAPVILRPPVAAPVFPAVGSRAVVTTVSDPLNLRTGPSTTSGVIKTIPRGSQVTIVGPITGGFFQVLPDLLGMPSPTNLPIPGFASAQFLGPVGGAFAPALAPVAFTPGAPFPNPGSTAQVSTATDPLNLRSGPSISASVIGSLPRNSLVTITGPLTGGFFPVQSLSGTGFASAQFLSAAGAVNPAQLPTVDLGDLGGLGGLGGLLSPASFPQPSAPVSIPFPLPGSVATVATANDPLNLRSGPSTSASVIGSLPRGSAVKVTGILQDGFLPVTQGGRSGFASAQFLSAAPAGTFAAGWGADIVGGGSPHGGHGGHGGGGHHGGGRRGGGGGGWGGGGGGWGGVLVQPVIPYCDPILDPFCPPGFVAGAPTLDPRASRDELQQTALALDTALKTNTCRAFNEPVTRRFQAAAKRAGIYSGEVDGWYGTKAQAALGTIVGNPSPPCFPEPTGGPVNPNSYWEPNPLAF